MINDARFIFSDEQAVAITDTSAPSTNLTDLGLADPNQGEGSNFFIRSIVSTAFTTMTSIQAALQDCDLVAGTYVDIAIGPVVLVADAIQGAKLLNVKLPDNHRKFLRINYTVVGTSAAGTINAYANVTP